MKKVFISPHFSKPAFQQIQSFLSSYDVKQPTSWGKGDNAVEAVLIRSSDLINQNFLDSFPNLKIVASATSGFDHFDLKEIKKSSVQFCYSPEANAQSAAELTVFHMLSLARKASSFTNKNLKWRHQDLLGHELHQKKISLMGFGRIGQRVSKFLLALGCKVFACDPYLKPDFILSQGVTPIDFMEALETSDLLSLHTPLTQKTQNLISKTQLSHMKPNAFLVNCARGELVCTLDLIQSLKDKQISGAALDVFDSEPLSLDSELRTLPQVLWTPHIGAYTFEAQKKSALEAAQQVKNWFEEPHAVLSSLPLDLDWAKDL